MGDTPRVVVKDWAAAQDDDDSKSQPLTPALLSSRNGSGLSVWSSPDPASDVSTPTSAGSSAGCLAPLAPGQPPRAPPPLPAKPTRPDDSELRAEMDALHRLIDRTRERLDSVNSQLEGHRRAELEGPSAEQRQLATRLRQLRQQRAELEAQRRGVAAEAEAVRRAQAATVARLRSMRRSGAVLLSTDAVEARISGGWRAPPLPWSGCL